MKTPTRKAAGRNRTGAEIMSRCEKCGIQIERVGGLAGYCSVCQDIVESTIHRPWFRQAQMEFCGVKSDLYHCMACRRYSPLPGTSNRPPNKWAKRLCMFGCPDSGDISDTDLDFLRELKVSWRAE